MTLEKEKKLALDLIFAESSWFTEFIKMQDDKNPTVFQMRFPQKLWYLLNLRTDAILWGGTGRTILLNYRVLHNYLQCDHSIFKTTNISSFVRQLNLYGFRKVTSHLQDPLCNSSNPYMHEYVHDYFQFGRPELLNKITRKALALRKNFKPKSLYGASADELSFITPLQKARRALQIALRKAAQGLLLQNSPKELCKLNFDYDDTPEDYCEDEENIDFNWMKNGQNVEDDLPNEPAEEQEQSAATINVNEDTNNYGETSQDSLMNFNDDSCQQNNDNFSNQFLSMPELDAEPNVDNSGVELLAEFDIDHDIDQGITRKLDKQIHQNSLNCVLPSITHDHIDDVSMAEKAIPNDNLDQYNDGEWDQMLNDIIINKSSNQESGTEFKELYSQISRTIDLLNS